MTLLGGMRIPHIVALGAIILSSAYAKGLGSNNDSAICIENERGVRELEINQDQESNGIEGGVVAPNSCKTLIQANVLGYRSDEEQQALCNNPCFTALNAKYKILLDNNCFASSDEDEAASANLQAAAYQIACQTTNKGKYCIPMLATLVSNAGTNYDLCDDIVGDMGCCFQSYKQYMKFGTSATIAILEEIQKTCTEKGVKDLDKVCPCGENHIYNKHVFPGTTICSGSWRAHLYSLALGAVCFAVVLVN